LIGKIALPELFGGAKGFLMALSDDLLAYVPEDKRKEFSEKVAGYVVLNDDIAVEHVKKSQSLTDRIATPIVEARFKNYKERDWPKEVETEREKIRLELTKGKEETPDQKTIRELNEWKAAQLKKEADELRKAEIRKKAAEFGLDPLKAERFYVLPDAENVLKELAEEAKGYKAKIEELEKKGKYGAGAPPAGSAAGPQDLDAQYAAAEKAGNGDLMLAIKDRIRASKGV
jgi:hypothetical protein